MKTNKVLVALLATTVIFSIGLSSSYAYNGNGQGQGKGQGTEQGQGQGQGKQSNKQEKDHNPSDMIADIEKQSVDYTEIDLLEKQYEEEMMANELYSSFYEMYGVETFKNIAESEAQHMEAVKALLDRYDIEVPSDYDHIQSLYEDLKAKGAVSLEDALEVGVSIEIVDIEDIITAIKSTDNEDIKTIFVNIGGASYNHMRGFVKALDNNNFSTDIDYSNYLDDEDLETKGTLKVKLAERLESEGVELPEQASSQAIKEKCDNENQGKNESSQKNKGQKGQEKSSSANKGQQGENQKNKNYNQSEKAKYKASYEAKYGDLISQMDDEKLNTFIDKVDTIIINVNSGDYSDSVKKKYNAMLLALKEIAVDNLDGNTDLDLDSLFN